MHYRNLELGFRADELSTRVKAITGLPDPDPSHAWLYDIDACDIPRGLIPRGGVVWFQCPWDGNGTVHELVRDFLLSTVKAMRDDHYVCIGITKQVPYVLDYNLQGILGFKLRGEDNSRLVLQDYRFLGANVSLVNEVLSFGYRHQGYKDIHELILKDHVTLVFQRKTRRRNYY